jgi:DNA mismatch endonuclease (patch repair protein)
MRDTGPEVALRRAVHRAVLLFRLHGKVAPRYTADFDLPRHHTAVFIDGCFRHGCPVHGAAGFRGPNAGRWAAKIAADKERDRRSTEAAEAAGWTVLCVWECEVRKDPVTAALRILEQCAAAHGPRAGPATKDGPRSR